MMALPPGAHMGGGRGMPMQMQGMVPGMPAYSMPPHSPGRYPGQQQSQQQRSPRSSGGYASRDGALLLGGRVVLLSGA